MHVTRFSYEFNTKKKQKQKPHTQKKPNPEMVILEAPSILIKLMFADMIIPFVILENTLIAFIALATLGSFQAASTLLRF